MAIIITTLWTGNKLFFKGGLIKVLFLFTQEVWAPCSNFSCFAPGPVQPVCVKPPRPVRCEGEDVPSGHRGSPPRAAAEGTVLGGTTPGRIYS